MERFVAELPRLIGVYFAGVCRAADRYEARVWSDGRVVVTREPSVWFNVAVIGDGPFAETRLHEATGLFADRAAPGLVVVSAQASTRLEPVARAAGLVAAGATSWILHQPARAVTRAADPTDAFEQVDDLAGLREANAVAAVGFGISPQAVNRVWGARLLGMLGFRLFLARRDGEAVSTVTTTEGGSTVGIWSMATHPDRQRQGVGRALLSHVLAVHTARGARTFFHGSTPEGRRPYEGVGFRTVTETALWIAGADGH